MTVATTAARYAIRAVASLNSDSPSINVIAVRGTPRRRNTDVAASASVGATIAPSANAAAQPMLGTSVWATAATTTVVKMTRAIERRAIGPRFRRRSRSGVWNAATNSSGGRNTTSTRSGSRVMLGRPGMKPSASPPSTNSAG